MNELARVKLSGDVEGDYVVLEQRSGRGSATSCSRAARRRASLGWSIASLWSERRMWLHGSAAAGRSCQMQVDEPRGHSAVGQIGTAEPASNMTMVKQR